MIYLAGLMQMAGGLLGLSIEFATRRYQKVLIVVAFGLVGAAYGAFLLHLRN